MDIAISDTTHNAEHRNTTSNSKQREPARNQINSTTNLATPTVVTHRTWQRGWEMGDRHRVLPLLYLGRSLLRKEDRRTSTSIFRDDTLNCRASTTLGDLLWLHLQSTHRILRQSVSLLGRFPLSSGNS